MKRIVLTLALFTVVSGAIALGQQTYTKYDPQADIHTPTFFTSGDACLSAVKFKVYQPRDTTRLGAWQEKLENNAAGVVSFPYDICVREQTAMGRQIFRMPANTPLFTQEGKVAADGRCGNEIFEVFLPPQPAPPMLPPPAVVRVPEPEPEPAPLPPPVVAEPPAHVCPTCEMTIDVHQKTKIIRLSHKASDGYLSGQWLIDGKEIGRGSSLMISRERLMKLAGKGEHEIVFKASDGQGHEIVCRGTVVLEQGRKGRFWLFKIPVLNCLYAYTVDIKNWSVSGTIEKAACAALGVGTWYTLTHGGAAALVGSKPPIRVISPP